MVITKVITATCLINMTTHGNRITYVVFPCNDPLPVAHPDKSRIAGNRIDCKHMSIFKFVRDKGQNQLECHDDGGGGEKKLVSGWQVGKIFGIGRVTCQAHDGFCFFGLERSRATS